MKLKIRLHCPVAGKTAVPQGYLRISGCLPVDWWDGDFPHESIEPLKFLTLSLGGGFSAEDQGRGSGSHLSSLRGLLSHLLHLSSILS